MNTPRLPSAALGLALLAPPLAAQTTVYDLAGAATGEGFGASVARLGDVDGDGFDDFVVGAPNASTNLPFAGAARVYSGQSGALLHEVLGFDSFAFLGTSVAAAPDFDGDGRTDFLLGVRGDDTNGTNSGVVHVFSGATDAFFVASFGDASGDAFGTSIAHVGDVNGDGLDDIAVGMPGSDVGAPDGGGFRVFSGATASVLFDFHGGAAGERLGTHLGAAGDVDGDGRADLLAATGSGPLGRVLVVSGGTQQVIYALVGDPTGDDFGRALTSIGDVDGDGVPDIAIGAPLANTGVPGGAVFVYSGATGQELFFVSGDEPGNLFGTSVEAAGDVDGDGLADFAVGIPGHDALVIEKDDGGGPPVVIGIDEDVGRVRVFSGAGGQLLHTVDGEATGGLFGWTLARLSDANLDGTSELVSGALLADRGLPQTGAVRVFSILPQTLATDTHLVSLSAGGRQTFTIDFLPALSGQYYWVLGSSSGTVPGVRTSAGKIYLNPDDYTIVTAALPYSGLITDPIGILDANGDATPYIDVPPGSDPTVEGVTLYHAVAIFDATTLALEHVTNTVPVTAVK
jgi:hypothetical protein